MDFIQILIDLPAEGGLGDLGGLGIITASVVRIFFPEFPAK